MIIYYLIDIDKSQHRVRQLSKVLNNQLYFNLKKGKKNY